ncbi:MAG: hypothetical protein QME49_04865 [bacterium]|nr:hypothetical protein [bacterium]
MSNGILMSKNRIDYNCAITSSSGTATPVVYDRNIKTKWQSMGSNDTITETITISFGGNRTMSRLILLNHNVRALELWHGATQILNQDNISQNYFYGIFTPFTATEVVLKLKTTQVDNQEKYVGEIIMSEHYYTLENNPAGIDYRCSEKAKEIELSDGTQKFWKIEGSDKAGITLSFEKITGAMCSQLEVIKKARYMQPFLLYLFPDTHPLSVYLMNWTNSYQQEIQQAWDSGGNRLYDLKVELREV